MLKIGSFVIDCKDFDKTMKFWQEALHDTPRRPPASDWVVLKGPIGKSPTVSVQGTDELKFGRNPYAPRLVCSRPESRSG